MCRRSSERQSEGISESEFAKGRFIGEMYARACYSMLLVSASGPVIISAPIRAVAVLPLSRGATIRLGRALLASIEHLLPKACHRQTLLMAALMGMLDPVLDAAAVLGETAALRLSVLFAEPRLAPASASEGMILRLVQAVRQKETAWQRRYWEHVLAPAVRSYCQAEVLAVEQASDPSGMGHRWAGLDAAIKGMWYVAGPRMGLDGDPSRFDARHWNREQQWMADASLLMQMIDDWVDQDEDRGVRLTPVVTGEWSLKLLSDHFDRTIRNLMLMLEAGGIHNPAINRLFVDLYLDYLHTAIGAMHTGLTV